MYSIARSGYAAILLTLISANLSMAAPCVSGSLSNYVALSGGCTIGTVQFDTFTLLPLAAAATGINPTNVLLTPTATPGFLISLGTTAAARQQFESTFSFMASGALFQSGTVGLIGSVVAADGANTGSAIFTPGGNAVAFDLGGGVNALTDSILLGGVNRVTTRLDFTIDGGLSGRASLSQGSIAFSTTSASGVPEPSTFVLLGSALLGLSWFGGRRNLTKTVKETGDKE